MASSKRRPNSHLEHGSQGLFWRARSWDGCREAAGQRASGLL